MKKIYLLICIILISSCYNNNEGEETIIEETGDIVDSYINDTLEGSIKDARDVVDIQNSRNKKLKDNIIKIK